MTLRIPAKVLLHVWSYDFYDMTLSTGKQRRHMINKYINGSGHMTKMVAIAIKTFKKSFFSRTRRPMILKLGMKHQR